MKVGSLFSRIYVILALLFLYTPIAVLIIMGFNVSRYNSLPFEFTLDWYRTLFENETLLQATGNSFWIAGITGIVCVILATLFVLGVHCLKSGVRGGAQTLMIMPLSVPWLIFGLSLLLMIRAFDFDKSMFWVLVGHIVISLPYALLVLQARIQSLDSALWEASASLGAGGLTTFRRIILPALAPAMIAGGFLSFMISFDNFVISYFLLPSGTSTLPVEIQSSIKFGFTPEINAVSTLIIGISLVCLIIVGVIMGSGIKNLFGGGKQMENKNGGGTWQK